MGRVRIHWLRVWVILSLVWVVINASWTGFALHGGYEQTRLGMTETPPSSLLEYLALGDPEGVKLAMAIMFIPPLFVLVIGWLWCKAWHWVVEID